MERILSVTKRWCVLTLWRLEVFTLLKYCTAKISSLLQMLWDNILVPLQGPSCPKELWSKWKLACIWNNVTAYQLGGKVMGKQSSCWSTDWIDRHLSGPFLWIMDTWKLVSLKKLSSCLWYVHFFAAHMRKMTWLCTIWWTSICVSAVWCYKNHRNVKVEPSLCLERSNGTAPSQSEPCFVDCQWPCVLSQWTEWTSCTHACTARTRTRYIIGESCFA